MRISAHRFACLARTSLVAASLAFIASSGAFASNYEEGWEDGVLDKPSLKKEGGCYSKPRYSYNSFEISGKRSRAGQNALRVELHGDDKNENCAISEAKSRAEIRHARTIDQFDNIPQDAEIWMGMSVYYPSDEGTFNSWWNKSSFPTFILMQLMGAGASYTPELHAMMKQGGYLVFEQTSSTAQVGEDLVVVKDEVKVMPDKWIDIVIHWNRTWKSTGFRQIWVDGKLIADRKGPSAIRDKPYAYYKSGLYFGYGGGVRPEVYVTYIDEVRLGGKDSSYDDVAPRSSATAAPSAPGLMVE